MVKISRQDLWQQETAKLKAHGFRWQFTGIVEGKKQWQLYTPDDKPVSKAEALAIIDRDEEWKEAEEWDRAMASIHTVYWEGYFSEAVLECDEMVIPATHQEGESYVGFPAEVQIKKEGDTTRYTLPSGKVFIMKDAFLYQEGEEE